MAQQTKTSSSTSSVPRGPPFVVDDTEEYRAKEARAKSLMLTALIPGSEPYKLALSLNSIYDIWLALEDRYCPDPTVTGKNIVNEWVTETSNSMGDVPQEEKAAALRAKIEEAVLVSKALQKCEAVMRDRRKEAQAAAARTLVENMPNRDQRFLWALLHGGKPETDAWFYGTSTESSTG